MLAFDKRLPRIDNSFWDSNKRNSVFTKLGKLFEPNLQIEKTGGWGKTWKFKTARIQTGFAVNDKRTNWPNWNGSQK